jgi:hypothetical protein
LCLSARLIYTFVGGQLTNSLLTPVFIDDLLWPLHFIFNYKYTKF